MKILICGGTGFVGLALTKFWAEQGYEIIIVSRRIRALTLDRETIKGRVTYVTWEQIEESERFEGTDVIVNLVGESLRQRWTDQAKERMLKSRLEAVKRVKKLVDRLEKKPEVVITASAIGIYGTSEHVTFDENSDERGDDFLADVVRQWEHAADDITGVRLIKLRIGLVLGNDGGAYPLMLLPYRLGVGGRMGSGKQWFRLINFAILDNTLSGPLNACVPNPITNEELGRSIGRIYHRPHWFALPEFILKRLLGEMSVLLLEGQRVMPVKAQAHGFEFNYPTIEFALNALRRR